MAARCRFGFRCIGESNAVPNFWVTIPVMGMDAVFRKGIAILAVFVIAGCALGIAACCVVFGVVRAKTAHRRFPDFHRVDRRVNQGKHHCR